MTLNSYSTHTLIRSWLHRWGRRSDQGYDAGKSDTIGDTTLENGTIGVKTLEKIDTIRVTILGTLCAMYMV